MTFDDDLILVHVQGGDVQHTCKALQIEWPPPRNLRLSHGMYRRIKYTQLTDREREEQGTQRVAEYRFLMGWK